MCPSGSYKLWQAPKCFPTHFISSKSFFSFLHYSISSCYIHLSSDLYVPRIKRSFFLYRYYFMPTFHSFPSIIGKDCHLISKAFFPNIYNLTISSYVCLSLFSYFQMYIIWKKNEVCNFSNYKIVSTHCSNIYYLLKIPCYVSLFLLLCFESCEVIDKFFNHFQFTFH